MKFWPLKPKIKAHGGTVWEQLISWASSRQFQDFLPTGEHAVRECVHVCVLRGKGRGREQEWERASVRQQAVPNPFSLHFHLSQSARLLCRKYIYHSAAVAERIRLLSGSHLSTCLSADWPWPCSKDQLSKLPSSFYRCFFLFFLAALEKEITQPSNDNYIKYMELCWN